MQRSTAMDKPVAGASAERAGQPVEGSGKMTEAANLQSSDSNRLPATVRMEAILARLNDGGSVTVGEIARMFGVSEMTVRRDLTELQRNGLLERVHGGAVAPLRGPLTLYDDAEPEFDARLRQNHLAKRAIARAALEHLGARRTLGFDLGTTVLGLARLMVRERPAADLRIFTNSLRVAQVMARARISAYLPGGLVRGEELSVTGQRAIAELSALYFDAVLLGAAGLTDEGVFDYSLEEVEVKEVFVRRASERILLIDSSKFRHTSTARFAALSDLSTIITDAQPPADLSAAIRKAGVELIVAPPVSPPHPAETA